MRCFMLILLIISLNRRYLRIETNQKNQNVTFLQIYLRPFMR